MSQLQQQRLQPGNSGSWWYLAWTLITCVTPYWPLIGWPRQCWTLIGGEASAVFTDHNTKLIASFDQGNASWLPKILSNGDYLDSWYISWSWSHKIHIDVHWFWTLNSKNLQFAIMNQSWVSLNFIVSCLVSCSSLHIYQTTNTPGSLPDPRKQAEAG